MEDVKRVKVYRQEHNLKHSPDTASQRVVEVISNPRATVSSTRLLSLTHTLFSGLGAYMDNPWATTWDQPDDRETNLPSTLSLRSPIVDQTHEQEEDLGRPSWPSGNDAQWPGPSPTSGALWTSSVDDNHAWGSSTYSKINLSRQGTVQAVLESETQQDDLVPAHSIPATAIAREEDSISPPVSSDTVEPPLALPTVEAVLLVPESPDIFGGLEAVVSTKEEDEETEDGGEAWADPIAVSTQDDDDWGVAWAESSSQEVSVRTEEPPDEWEAARQEKEKLNRAVV